MLAAADADTVGAADRLGSLTSGLGVASLVLLAAGIALRRPGAVPWALLSAAGAYLAGNRRTVSVDGWTAVLGVALLISAELAFWSIEHHSRIRTERALLVQRVSLLVALTAGALFVNLMLLAAAGVATDGGVIAVALGVAAAVTALAVVLRLVRN